MLEGFRLYLETEEEDNVKSLIARLPPGHRKLLDGYKFKFTPGNTLKGDEAHIGFIHGNRIVVAAPWNYSRSFTTLHEIAHLVWEYKMTPALKKEWEVLFRANKAAQKAKVPASSRSALDQNAEEIYCMVYATAYSKHPAVTYSDPDWLAFIRKKVPG